MKSIVSVLVSFVILFVPNMAHAHEPAKSNDGYCGHAQTTADLVQCSKTNVNVKTQRLNELYDLFSDIVMDKSLKKSVDADQQVWLNDYRRTCSNEKQALIGESSAIIQDFTCRARQIDNRIEHLKSLINAIDPREIPTYANPPRWMNVLSVEYKNIFWDLSSRQTIDTDCDGVKEGVINGLRKMENEDDYKVVWAITDSARTGRPVINLINFEQTKNCDLLPEIEYGIIPDMKPLDNASNTVKNTCYGRLLLSTKNCGRFTIGYDIDTQSYDLKEFKSIEEEKEKKNVE
jgi:uncharacterized protein YecT (DUF1311 family)